METASIHVHVSLAGEFEFRLLSFEVDPLNPNPLITKYGQRIDGLSHHFNKMV
jgi:hypothetical protein